MTVPNRIDATGLVSALLRPAGPYTAIEVVSSTGSTNADLRSAATEGAADRSVLIAEEQTAGTGRRGRTWSSPAGAGVYCSVLFRPGQMPFSALSTLPIAAGLALVDMANAVGLHTALKWPNDVLTVSGEAKWAGILAESLSSEERVVVLGIGVNVFPPSEPVQLGPGGISATSLAEQNVRIDPTEVARLLLTFLDQRERQWRAGGGDLHRSDLLDEYRANCATLGREVTVQVSCGPSRIGRAVDVDASGALVLMTNTGVRETIRAGDVVHLRPAQG